MTGLLQSMNPQVTTLRQPQNTPESILLRQLGHQATTWTHFILHIRAKKIFHMQAS